MQGKIVEIWSVVLHIGLRQSKWEGEGKSNFLQIKNRTEVLSFFIRFSHNICHNQKDQGELPTAKLKILQWASFNQPFSHLGWFATQVTKRASEQ